MAARLILSMDGAVLKEYALNKERMTVGRKPHNDIVIDNLAVSSEHAAIVTILNDSFLEDLDSTNGVTVNGVAIKKHFLQNNDVIEIGKYTLKYINEQPAQRAESSEEDFEKTMVMRAPARQPQAVPPPPPAAPQLAAEPARATVGVKPAAIQILSGPNAGRELDLVKSLTTLGRTGVQVAVLTRRPHSYFITHVEGANYPLLNGRALNDQPHPLNNHDIIELAGVKMEFYFKE
jgi:pSer/pThr/pTyr-binding forkhead associated (FHA) protein